MSENIENQDKKELKDILRKCRCCLRLIIDDRRAVDIDETIRERFFNLTTIQLLQIDQISNRICLLCAGDLETFSNLRSDLVSKQSTIYKWLGLDQQAEEAEEIEIEEEVIEKQDEQPSESIEYEIIEGYCDDEMEEVPAWDDAVDESSVITYLSDEDTLSETPNAILKIEKVSSSESSRKRPRIKMEEEGYFEECLEEYDNSSNIDSAEEEITKCTLCDIDILQTHFNLHCEVMHADLKCEKCDETFQSKILLKRHDRDAHAVVAVKGQRAKRRYHFCGLCDKDYEYKKHLEDHIRSFHLRVRNTKCEVCNRYFYHRDIKKHIDHVHGERKVVCKICGKLYTCVENLKLHMRYHDEPKYICEFTDCGKKFHQKILWEHHMLKHSTDKPVECNQCGNQFYTVRDLKRHTQRVHKKVTRKCFKCDCTFYRKDKYREHILKSHKELSEKEKLNVLESIRVLKWNEED